MVYRHTPLASAMRGYTAGGSRASIGPIDDSKLMQETNNCQGMRGESWGRMEAPQNYGFTSVTADPDEDEKTGMRKDSAEGMVSFMGGNRWAQRTIGAIGCSISPRTRRKARSRCSVCGNGDSSSSIPKTACT